MAPIDLMTRSFTAPMYQVIDRLALHYSQTRRRSEIKAGLAERFMSNIVLEILIS